MRSDQGSKTSHETKGRPRTQEEGWNERGREGQNLGCRQSTLGEGQGGGQEILVGCFVRILRELEPDGFSFLRLIHRFDKYDLIVQYHQSRNPSLFPSVSPRGNPRVKLIWHRRTS
jgi:hypothetical protein